MSYHRALLHCNTSCVYAAVFTSVGVLLTGLQRGVYNCPFFSYVSCSAQVITKAHGLGQSF